MSERVMTRWDAFVALCLARFREFYRESEVVFWSFIFPVILSVGLGIAFRDRPVEVLPVAIVKLPGAGPIEAGLRGVAFLSVKTMDEAEAAQALRMGRVSVVVVPTEAAGPVYRFDPARPESILARARVDEALQRAAGRRDAIRAKDQEVSEPGARYIDFLVPGIIGMNLMSGGMWGVGFNLVDMRIKKLLKRLLATPMRRGDFMLAQMAIRVVFMIIEVTFLLTFGHLVFGLPVRGSWVAVLVVGMVGALSFGGLGLLLASRARKIEGVMGLMNAVMMPMFVCSGTFFSAERFPDSVQGLIRILPLTALNDALRSVILEGSSLITQTDRLSILAVWGIVSFIAGLRFFRWT